METKSSMASAIDVTQAHADYDAACKRLLSEKQILAWILKSCVEEFKELDIKTIAETCIEGVPYVSEIPVAPDETGPVIRGMNTEQSSPTEGSVFFDIYFNAVVPGTGEVVQLIINVEAQGDFYPGYPIPKRGIFYCGRMISAQSGTVFEKSEYDKLRKVYSIWVCLSPPRESENTITYYSMAEHNLVGAHHEARQNYDLLTLVICLGRERVERYEGVLKLLGTLFKSSASAEEKKRILQDEFSIPMTETIDREVSFMGGSFFEAAMASRYETGVEKGMEKGRSLGFEDGILSSIKLLMKNSGWPFEKAAATLEVPQEQWGSYAQLAQQP